MNKIFLFLSLIINYNSQQLRFEKSYIEEYLSRLLKDKNYSSYIQEMTKFENPLLEYNPLIAALGQNTTSRGFVQTPQSSQNYTNQLYSQQNSQKQSGYLYNPNQQPQLSGVNQSYNTGGTNEFENYATFITKDQQSGQKNEIGTYQQTTAPNTVLTTWYQSKNSNSSQLKPSKSGQKYQHEGVLFKDKNTYKILSKEGFLSDPFGISNNDPSQSLNPF